MGQRGPELDVSVIIVNYNTRDYVLDCLESVYAQAGNVSFEVIVADNASQDGSCKAIRERFPAVTLFDNKDNRGFAGANNQGLRIARGRYVLLLNPDTIVLDRAIEKMVRYMDEHPDIGCSGCQVMLDASEIQRTCFRFPSPLNVLLDTTGLSRLFPRSRFFGRYWMGWWDRCSERDVDVVSGMFMLLRREVVEEVGLMDEDYFVYAEEADWCYRMWKHGWRRVFAPIAQIIHREGGGKSTRLMKTRMYVQVQKSLLIFHRKNLGLAAYWVCRLLFAGFMALRACAAGILVLAKGDEVARAKLDQSVAAARFHLGSSRL